jgi:hypothetical protein
MTSKTMVRGVLLLLILNGCARQPPCGWGSDCGELPDGGGREDGDVIPDGDGDVDSDVDIDSDTDSDGDHIQPLPEEECASYNRDGEDIGDYDPCANDRDEDEDGFVDCDDPGCFTAPVCCRSLPVPPIDSDFTTCRSFPTCGWRAFPDDLSAMPSIGEESEIELHANEQGETGIYSETTLGLAGTPTLSFTASLDPVICGEWCRHVVGVALTSQTSLAGGTGVSPVAGIVLDGEVSAAHLFVNGRRETTMILDQRLLVSGKLWAFRVESNGSVSFWLGLDVVEGIEPDLSSVEPSYRSDGVMDIMTSGVRVVAFGNIEDEGTARLGRLEIEQLACNVPEGWQRSGHAVLGSGEADERVGRPSVATLDDAGTLVMVHEMASDLWVATSSDRGETWTPIGPAFRDPPTTEYGLVARRSPAILWWGPPSDETPAVFHMWFVGVAEVSPDTPAGVTPTAILHAESVDGLEWIEDDDPAVIEVDATRPFLSEVRDPTVTAMAPQRATLKMWFVGRQPATGESAILRATSTDGKLWTVWAEPIDLGTGDPESWERDGRVQPMVVSSDGELGAIYHLWYVGLSGSRSTIGYALSTDGIDWMPYGPVLEVTERWEGTQVGGPAVLGATGPGESVDVLRMWYQAGVAGRERIGAAWRYTPVL